MRNLFFALLVLLNLLQCFAEAQHQWYLLPTFQTCVRGIEHHDAALFPQTIPQNIAAQLSMIPASAAKRQEWLPVHFPDQEFVKQMPMRNVYGWYGHKFDVPEELQGWDLLLDLGIVDDADETYLNSILVGKTGQIPGGSAWQEHRHYRIPAKLLHERQNFLAIHAWSIWGLGGMACQPVLKAALSSDTDAWEMAVVKPQNAPSKLNERRSLNELTQTLSLPSSLEWRKVTTPWTNCPPWQDDEHYALWRIPLCARQKHKFSAPFVLDLGLIHDVAAIFLNQKKVGQLGRFPEGRQPAFTEAAQRAQVLVSPEDWNSDGDNTLTVFIYRERGTGGVFGLPGVLLQNPLDSHAADFRRALQAAEIHLQSGKGDEAWNCVDMARPTTDMEHVWKESYLAHLLYLKWLHSGEKHHELVAEFLQHITAMLHHHPQQSPKQSAMQALAHLARTAETHPEIAKLFQSAFPQFRRNVRFLNFDRETKGDWYFYYGKRQFILCSMGQIQDWRDETTLKSSTKVKVVGNDLPRHWLAANNRRVSAHEALMIPPFLYRQQYIRKLIASTPKTLFPFMPQEKIRRAAWWDDHGEMHPFDDEGPDLYVSFTPNRQGCNHVSCYVNDFDWRNTVHPRQQSVLITDTNGQLQECIWLGKPDQGVYLKLVLDDNRIIDLRIMKHRGACVALNAIFVDGPLRFADTHIHRTDRVPYFKKYSDWEAGRRLKKLGKEAQEAFKIVLEAERAFCFHPQRQQFAEALQHLAQPVETFKLIDQLMRLDNSHLVWLTMAMAHLNHTLHRATPEMQIKIIRELFRLCIHREWEVFRYPLADNWIKLGLSQDDPFFKSTVSKCLKNINPKEN